MHLSVKLTFAFYVLTMEETGVERVLSFPIGLSVTTQKSMQFLVTEVLLLVIDKNKVYHVLTNITIIQ